LPAVSVVIATRNRAARLARQLAALRRQTLEREAFEVIVVDDASTDATAAILEAELDRLELPLLVLREKRPGGPALARNHGWRRARGGLVAFTDDDCEASPRWLEELLAAWAGDDRRIVQGATAPIAAELSQLGPFAYTIDIAGPTAEFETCNVAYPRALLEALGGFHEAYRAPFGEDTDLAWRALESGAERVFAPAARVEHAVNQMGPIGVLQRAWRAQEAVRPYKQHPELRRQRLHKGVFWNWPHYLLLRALLGLPLLRRRWGWPLAAWLAGRLVAYEVAKARRQGSVALAPFWLLHDVVETAAIVRGAARHRTLVL
jgi:glycosyltransferase involved in cell wall biosynthesis